MTSKAIVSIVAERERQISKGYDAAYDDLDVKGNHAQMGAAYARASVDMRQGATPGEAQCYAIDELEIPWGKNHFSIEPTARENLVKSAALMVAEIERIDREEQGND